MFERNGNPGIASARLAYVIAMALVDIAASLRRAAPMETATDMREVTPGAMAPGREVGIFLDPPYDTDVRGECYNTDAEHGKISAAVKEWVLENGDNPRYRIVLAGYDGEHEMPPTWREVAWKARRAYGRANGDTDNSENRKKERLWLSPHCVDDKIKQAVLL